MGTCTNCGGFVEPALKPMHVNEHNSTQYEVVRATCWGCGTIYIFNDGPLPASDLGNHVVTFLPEEPESGTD